MIIGNVPVMDNLILDSDKSSTLVRRGGDDGQQTTLVRLGGASLFGLQALFYLVIGWKLCSYLELLLPEKQQNFQLPTSNLQPPTSHFQPYRTPFVLGS